MPNWKEQAEAEINSIRVAEETRRSEAAVTAEQKRQSDYQSALIAIEKHTVLRLPEKLQEINREVLRGLGDVVISPVTIESGSLPKASASFTLEHFKPTTADIGEKGEGIKERRFGTYYFSVKGGSQGTGDTFSTHKGFGWHDEFNKYKVVGVSGEKTYPSHIQLFLSSNPTNSKIIARDYLVVPELPKVTFPDSWKYYLDYSSRSVTLTFPNDQFNSELLNSFLDAFLLKSCVARVSYIDQWLREKAEVDAKIREINSRIGKVYYYQR